ncbi:MULTISPECIES: hypothetical protein [Vibrio]|uniref:hypothetical protein n=1 Tax=Vibrio TaxID=662 RepID=UPI000A3CAE51|nr:MULTISPECIES: hypothetical protein [Vibrio]PMJ61663.1 hypothetical protein BCU18_05455 [Vibrio lentus]PMM05619.1 hypothetical protein BCT63_09255 [Vibrio kanaloae]
MEQRDLEIRFAAGELTKAVVVPEVFGDNWNLMFVGKKKSDQYYVTLQRSETLRGFKTTDAAIGVARKVGFLSVSVEMSGLA